MQEATKTPIEIRPPRAADFERWKILWDGYNAFYGREGPTALPEEITRTTWERFFDEHEPVHALLAESGGEVIGIVHYLFHRSTILAGPTCYLQDLFTTKAARGRGAGRALIEAVYAKAQAAGASRVYWHTHETNRKARDLYDKVADDTGFVVYRKMV
jgi:GNAT superfamily N-acetyltransferase